MTGLLLRATGLAVGHGQAVLRSVALEVGSGECWFVLGRNGAGKSVLLATLLGLLPPLHGTVERSAVPGDGTALGFVPQEVDWSDTLPLTVDEVVGLGLWSLPRRGCRPAVQQALEAMALGPLATVPVTRLSVGLRRRTLVAQALARQPRLLVLDEPTANLDLLSARALCRDLEQLRCTQGLGIVHATHDLELARAFATHVACVAGGTVATGVAGSMLASHELRAALLGEAT